MDLLGQKVLELCAEFQGIGYVIITLCCIVIGVIFSLSDEGTEKVKKRAPFIVLGWLLIMGGLTLGAKYGNELRF